MNFSLDPNLPAALDASDALAELRSRFVITDPDTIYMDGNSLGRLPTAAAERMREVVEQQWGERLIRGWNDGWIETPARLGAKLAHLLGAQPDEVLVADSTSVNLFKLAVAALRARPQRRRLVSDSLNFPSDLYIFQGILDLLGGGRSLELIPSFDGLQTRQEDLEKTLGPDTALLSLSHVAFKSAFLYDMQAVTRLAHEQGALVLWDLSHSAGALPIDLNGWGVDLAVGCTYKYLNGGPGAPAYLYVRRDLQAELQQPIWGWFGANRPFAFDLDYSPADGMARYQIGTPPVLSLLALEPGLDLLAEAGVERLRAKSIQQTEYLLFLFQHWLEPLGFRLGSPLEPGQRGSHLSLRHPEAYRINWALINDPSVRVIPDFRAPDSLRLGIAPLYTSYLDIYRAADRIRLVTENKTYLNAPAQQARVT